MSDPTRPSDQEHDGNTVNTNTTESPPKSGEKTFLKFTQLPPELRIQIYTHAAAACPAIRTLGISASNRLVSVHTLQHYHHRHALCSTSAESREEVRRLSIPLPTRFVNDIGLNMLNMNAGEYRRLPGSTLEMRSKMYHRDTIFLMDEQTAVDVFLGDGKAVLSVAGDLGWVKSLMLYGNTFEHIHMLRDAPFARLPSLERVFVAFMKRYENIALVEGAFDEVARELDVVRDGDGDWKVDVKGGIGRLEPEMQAMVIETVSNTVEDVDAMARAGIEVHWVVAEEGAVRMPFSLEWHYFGDI
ncbi:hypothetical protein GGR57DRAFT_51819 [Xylariaceae sp. FL1272]|nr:hypothetical protein GGR57DRAFT_51819 [Xylariaceae sp. FL1272]